MHMATSMELLPQICKQIGEPYYILIFILLSFGFKSSLFWRICYASPSCNPPSFCLITLFFYPKETQLNVYICTAWGEDKGVRVGSPCERESQGETGGAAFNHKACIITSMIALIVG